MQPRRLFVLLLAAVLASLAFARWGELGRPANITISGEVHVMAMDFEDGNTELEYQLHSTTQAEDGLSVAIYRLEGPLVGQLRSGQLVTVAGHAARSSSVVGMENSAASQAGPSQVLEVSSIQHLTEPELDTPQGERAPVSSNDGSSPGGEDSLGAKLPVSQPSINTLVLPLSFADCPSPSGGRYPAPWWTKPDVEGVFFENAGDASRWSTVAGRFRACSYGQSLMTRANSAVTPVLKIPCAGRTSWGTQYNVLQCSATDYNGFQQAGLDAAKQLGIDHTRYKYKVVLLPNGNACPFLGTSKLGCPAGGLCGTWIQGTVVMGRTRSDPRSTHHVLREMGHNLYLNNAAAGGDENGDLSCAMGHPTSSRCYNAPHAWQLGWIAPKELDGTTLGPGATRVVAIYTQTRSKLSGLRINPTWVRAGVPLYVSHRLAEGGDKQLAPQLSNHVLVHSYGGRTNTDTQLTRQLAALPLGGSWTDNPTGLTIRFTKAFPAAGGNITLAVCRRAAGGLETAETCKAGLDGDCDGLLGGADPDCWAWKPRQADTA